MQSVIKDRFRGGLSTLGFVLEEKEGLYFCDREYNTDNFELQFHLERGKNLNANAVFFTKQLNSFKPQVLLYDQTGQRLDENQITVIQKRVWSSGVVPLVCIFYENEVKILDCTTHILNSKPVYLEETISLVSNITNEYYKDFANKIKTGVIWDEEKWKNKFKFSNSAYDKLIDWIKRIKIEISQEYPKVEISMINKIIVQAILIKYLEEKKDDTGNGLFGRKYFPNICQKYSFTELLRVKGSFAKLLEILNKDLNGNLFEWNDYELAKISKLNLTTIANALEGNSESNGQMAFEFIRYYDFSCIPIELISRMYEEFLAGIEPKKKNSIEKTQAKAKQENGIFYTPSHLAQLLVDETMPLKDYDKVDLYNFKILDPACGSGIFLVLAYKRLIQWWRLKNGFENRPNLEQLKQLLKNIFGVDKEKQATQLTAFSLCLALCEELSPLQIITKLKFDDLTKTNLLYSDFFIDELETTIHESTQQDFAIQKENLSKINSFEYSLIIGNPPFDRGAIKSYSNLWKINDQQVSIPQGQIALKFLSESLFKLKKGGLLCLIIKSSNLLYNSTSNEYINALFSNYNVLQVLDFTALARNKSLWDNGADVATASIFIRNEKPDFNKNILHLTFRRTKATKERIIFEADYYDFHFISKTDAIQNPHIWKSNLLGGGRIKSIVNKSSQYPTLEHYINENDFMVGEGYIRGTNGTLNPPFMFEFDTIPTEAINEDGIDYSYLARMNKNSLFVKIPPKELFVAPNIILWENIGDKELPIFMNKRTFTFKHKIIAINKPDNKPLLKELFNALKKNNNYYRFIIYVTSSQLLINKNTALLKKDFMSLPFIDVNIEVELSTSEMNIVNDVNIYMQDLIRHGEKSLALKKMPNTKLPEIISNYGIEFCNTLNTVYENADKKFRLAEVINFNNDNFIATVFKYDSKANETTHREMNTIDDFKIIMEYSSSSNIFTNRILKFYSNDTVIFIKPNQYRYWLSIIAYRDADSCFVDLVNSGY